MRFIHSPFVRDFIAKARKSCYELADLRRVYLNRQDELIAATTLGLLRVFTKEEAEEFDLLTGFIRRVDGQLQEWNAKVQHYVIADERAWAELNRLNQEIETAASEERKRKKPLHLPRAKKVVPAPEPPAPCRCWQCTGQPARQPQFEIEEFTAVPIALVAEDELKEIRPHFLSDDLDRQARAIRSWSPSGRYQRARSFRARRYEGFTRTA